jgi:hypothetical protein
MYHGRFLARIATHNLLQYEDVEYTDEELAKCRMVTKGLNGIVFTVDMFREMYPDAVFFALIRNGLAVCEGRSRRGYPVAKFAQEYHDIVTRMLQYEEEMPNYHILKFEDMVTAPLETFNKIYKLADLDPSEVKKIRLESKATMDAHGNHKLEKGHDRQVFWYEPDEVHTHIKPNINKNQIKNFNEKDKSLFLSVSGGVMEKLGYETY